MKNKIYPPGPDSKFLLALLWQIHRDPLGVAARLAREYGDVVQLRVGSRRYILLNHPEYIKQVLTCDKMFRSFPLATKCLLGNGLLTSQDELHRRQRHLLNPWFHRQRIDALDATVTGCAEKAMRRWTDGSHIDVGQEMMRLTFAIIVQALWGDGVEEDIDAVLEEFAVVIKMTERNKAPFLDKLLGRLPLRSNSRFQRAVDYLHGMIRGLVSERKSGDLYGKDFLSFLLKAQRSPEQVRDLSDQQIQDEIMTLLLAGHETTSNALTWTWYLLSQHPDAETRLHEELEAVLGGRTPVAADLPRLRYTRMVFSETLRLYPPVWLVSRRPTEDVEIGGYHVPAWSSVNMSPFLTHRDPRYFADPEQFQPQRWLPEERLKRPRFSFFPFGGGPHRCIGEGLAMAEGPLLAATVAQRWRLRLVKDHPVRFEPLITLRPEHGMLMTLEEREQATSRRASV